MNRLAAELFAGYLSKPLVYTPPDKDFVATNPSIFFDGKVWRCMLRCINYRLGARIPQIVYTRTVMAEIDPATWDVAAAVPMADQAERVRTNYYVHGYEDCRLFAWRGKLWASATCCDLTPQGNREIVLLEFDATYTVVNVYPLRGMWSSFFQKNWIPVVQGEQLSFVYAIDRGIVIDLDPELKASPIVIEDGIERRQEQIRWQVGTELRGSSQAIRMGDKWLILVHDKFYRSRFVLVNNIMRIVQWTPEFYFRKPGIEFSAGAAIDPKGQQVVVSYSVNDATCELGFFPLESVMSRLGPTNLETPRIIRS